MPVNKYLKAQIIGPESWTPVDCHLTYGANEPYAVSFEFATGQKWMVARDLIRAGLQHPAGLGDARFWPASDASDVLFLHLRAPSGEALIELPRHEVAEFLDAADQLITPGLERQPFSENELDGLA